MITPQQAKYQLHIHPSVLPINSGDKNYRMKPIRGLQLIYQIQNTVLKRKIRFKYSLAYSKALKTQSANCITTTNNYHKSMVEVFLGKKETHQSRREYKRFTLYPLWKMRIWEKKCNAYFALYSNLSIFSLLQNNFTLNTVKRCYNRGQNSSSSYLTLCKHYKVPWKDKVLHLLIVATVSQNGVKS